MKSVLVVVAGCSYVSGAAVTGTASTDAGRDAAPLCTVSPRPRPTLAPSLGGSGGNVEADLLCPSGQFPIGVGFDTTTNPRPEGGNGGERVARAISVSCGTIELWSDGHYRITAGAMVSRNTNACGDPAWSPVTTAPAVGCPLDTILVGLVGNGGQTSLFNTVKLACGSLTPPAAIGAGTTMIAVIDTGNYTNNPQTALCPSGEAVVAFGIRANCGLDELTPVCAALQCM